MTTQSQDLEFKIKQKIKHLEQKLVSIHSFNEAKKILTDNLDLLGDEAKKFLASEIHPKLKRRQQKVLEKAFPFLTKAKTEPEAEVGGQEAGGEVSGVVDGFQEAGEQDENADEADTVADDEQADEQTDDEADEQGNETQDNQADEADEAKQEAPEPVKPQYAEPPFKRKDKKGKKHKGLNKHF